MIKVCGAPYASEFCWEACQTNGQGLRDDTLSLGNLLEKDMLKKLSLIAFLIAAFVASNVEANAARACAPYDAIKKSLSGKYNESRKAYGLAGGKRIMEIFVSEKGTWTVIVTNLQGLSCILAVGDNWEDMPQVKTGAPT